MLCQLSYAGPAGSDLVERPADGKTTVNHVRKILLSPKWWGLHLLAIFLVVLFLRLGLWQWHRAQSPSGGIQNYAYAFQWPLFAVFGIVLYWKTLRIELAGEADETGESPRPLSGPLAGLANKPLPELKIEHKPGVDGKPSVRIEAVGVEDVDVIHAHP